MPDPSPSHRVLLVEDEFIVRLTLAEALSNEGFDVVEASSGDEALVVLRADAAIVLLLTDIQLPGSLDGLGLARLAREARPELPTIFMSGRPEIMDGSASARDAFITKPYLPSEVAAAARRLTAGT
ncbi:MAG TPA: response regulator [Acetobacteraceae bacterium]|nr:response regulator [Acetobacteraceae bacterium]